MLRNYPNQRELRNWPCRLFSSEGAWWESELAKSHSKYSLGEMNDVIKVPVLTGA
jgi:hypothetical protein